jgi:phenylpropionate dioxygenase-like ring-hydroxylating dioxygenase large terminal subunit
MAPHILQYFHPVLLSRALGKRPVRVTLAGHPVVLFRDAAGRAAALDDRCPHRRASLSQGTVRPDGRLVCPYHGWNFDAAGSCRSPSDPSLTCNTGAYQIVERLDHLWLAHRETPLAKFPVPDWESFEFAGSLSILVQAPLELTLDNISEDEHFPFIHTTFGCGEDELPDATFAARLFDDYSEASYSGPQRSSFWAPLGGVRAGDQFYNHWYTRFDPVRAVYTFGWHDRVSGSERPITTRAVVFLIPETLTTTRITMFIFLRIKPGLYRSLRRVMHFFARTIAYKELKRDGKLIELVAEAPTTIQGMRLTRFDKALVYNRRLLQTVYWGSTEHPRRTPEVPQSLQPFESGEVLVCSEDN